MKNVTSGGRLFRKYVVFFVGLVSAALLAGKVQAKRAVAQAEQDLLAPLDASERCTGALAVVAAPPHAVEPGARVGIMPSRRAGGGMSMVVRRDGYSASPRATTRPT